MPFLMKIKQYNHYEKAESINIPFEAKYNIKCWSYGFDWYDISK